jgi:hypothetical protein
MVQEVRSDEEIAGALEAAKPRLALEGVIGFQDAVAATKRNWARS